MKTSNNPAITNDFPAETSVKPHYYKFLNAGVSIPILANSPKGQKLTAIKVWPCSQGNFPRVNLVGPGQYLPVCENKHCLCPNQKKITSQPSHELALLEWNKYRTIGSSDDLFHPTVKVSQLPLKEIKLNLAVEQMYLDKFLAKFSRCQLAKGDRRVFVLREKWLEVVRFQLQSLEHHQG